MTVVNLTNPPQGIITGNDSIVIKKYIDGITSGRTLDVTGYKPSEINAGHVIIKDSQGDYKPMPLSASGDAYASLPEGSSYAGILVATIPTNKAMAGIMTRGKVNPKVTPFPMDTIMDAVKAALPLIEFEED